LSANRIGIFYGTDTGRTRRVAKLISQKLSAAAAAPVNINRAGIADLLAHRRLILGTPTLGRGELPGLASGAQTGGWLEFLPQFDGQDLSGLTVAIFGLGDQEKYPDEFVSGVAQLHRRLVAGGARMVGTWDAAGYRFAASEAVVDGRFLGLALDQINQPSLTEERIDRWLGQLGREWAEA
jgi:flavodoxin I